MIFQILVPVNIVPLCDILEFYTNNTLCSFCRLFYNCAYCYRYERTPLLKFPSNCIKDSLLFFKWESRILHPSIISSLLSFSCLHFLSLLPSSSLNFRKQKHVSLRHHIAPSLVYISARLSFPGKQYIVLFCSLSNIIFLCIIISSEIHIPYRFSLHTRIDIFHHSLLYVTMLLCSRIYLQILYYHQRFFVQLM